MNGLQAYALALIETYKPGNFGYVFGAQGQMITEAELKRLQKVVGDRAPGGASYYDQRRTRAWIGGPAADCSGLIMYFLEQMNVYDHDMTADMLYRSCERTNIQGRTPGDLAFKIKNRVAVHVGIYTGYSETVQARGTDYGVVTTNDDEYTWSCFGRPRFKVPDIDWAEPYFNYLQNEGIGYADRRFNSHLTRGEYFAARAKEIQAEKRNK